MNPLLMRARRRQDSALRIVAELDLIKRWARFGRPVVVGSVSHGLVVEPDIDLEVHSENPQIAEGMAVMAEVTTCPHVIGLVFKNDPATRGKWLYWEVRYRDGDGPTWTIETYHCGPGDPYAKFSERLARAMRRALTDQHRLAILAIKEALCGREIMRTYRSLDIYRAVMEDGIASLDEFLPWVEINKAAGISDWLPGGDLPFANGHV